MLNTEIKYYVHSNNNISQLSNSFGCVLKVLDDCLINGIPIGPASSLTANGLVAQLIFSVPHNLRQYQVIKIEGSNVSQFNGEFKISNIINETTISFILESTPSSTTSTGILNCTLPPLGWEKPFSSTHSSGVGGKGAYRSTNVQQLHRPFLRVVDEIDPSYTETYAKYAKVGLVEGMTDINTMLGVQAPYDSANPNKNWVATGSGTSVMNGWSKWYYAYGGISFLTSTSETTTIAEGNRNWFLIGTKDYFYLLPTGSPNNNTSLLYGFGLFEKIIDTDTSNHFLISTLNSVTASIGYYRGSFTGGMGTSNTQKVLLQRSYAQNSQYTKGYTFSLGVTADLSSGAANYIGSVALAGISPFAPVYINETVLRGSLKGVYWLFQQKPYNHSEIIEYKNEAFIALNCAPSTTAEGQVVLKIGDF